MDREESLKVLSERILKVIDELDSISEEYANWDEWDKAKIIDSSLEPLKRGFYGEILERLNKNFRDLDRSE